MCIYIYMYMYMCAMCIYIYACIYLCLFWMHIRKQNSGFSRHVICRLLHMVLCRENETGVTFVWFLTWLLKYLGARPTWENYTGSYTYQPRPSDVDRSHLVGALRFTVRWCVLMHSRGFAWLPRTSAAHQTGLNHFESVFGSSGLRTLTTMASTRRAGATCRSAHHRLWDCWNGDLILRYFLKF